VVGAPYAQAGLGRIAVFIGASGTGLQTTPVQVVAGDAANGLFGFSLTNGGFLDDLTAVARTQDIVVGQPGFNNFQGRAMVLTSTQNADVSCALAGVFTASGNSFATNIGTMNFAFNISNSGPAPIRRTVTVTFTFDIVFPSHASTPITFTSGSLQCGAVVSRVLTCTTAADGQGDHLAVGQMIRGTLMYAALTANSALDAPTSTTSMSLALDPADDTYDATTSDYSATSTGNVRAVASFGFDQAVGLTIKARDINGDLIPDTQVLTTDDRAFIDTVAFRNTGPSTATGVVLTILLPTGVIARNVSLATFSGPAASSIGCSSGSRITCVIQSFPVSETVSSPVSLRVHVCLRTALTRACNAVHHHLQHCPCDRRKLGICQYLGIRQPERVADH
jgi:hypothetical protein